MMPGFREVELKHIHDGMAHPATPAVSAENKCKDTRYANIYPCKHIEQQG
jgi:hypothetical protein